MTVLVLAILAGSCVGSFVNVVIDRLPAMLDRRWRDDALGSLHIAPQDSRPVFNLAWPGSRCSACGAPVKPRDNIPVLSWIMLRGRCRHCAAPIAVRLPGVEAAGAILVLAVLAVWGYTVGALAFYVFLMALLAAAVIDAETQL
ncbi:MAG: prepilin peptidase, partial [Pseudomonadales bacterium]|nr:prepilin peptidase [Pseudomonadales bacterium]